jgi:hypothetical protein
MRGPELLEGIGRRGAGLTGQGEQEVLGSDDRVPQTPCFVAGESDDATSARCESIGHGWNVPGRSPPEAWQAGRMQVWSLSARDGSNDVLTVVE